MKLPQVTRLHSGREVLLREYVGLGLITGLSVGVIWGLSTGLSFGQASGLDNALNYGVLGGLPLGLMYGLSYGQAVILLQILLRGRTKVIEPAEKILWSWKSLRKSLFASKHLRNTLLVGLSAGVIWGVIWGVVNYRSGTGMSGELIAGLSVGLRVGLIALTSYWALLGLFAGISNEILPEERRIRPNEGIRRSARNSLLVASIGGVVSGVSVGLSYVVSSLLSLEIGMGMSFGLANMLGIPLYLGLSPIQQYGLDYIRTLALPVVLVGGLLSGLLSGGLACLQHSIVRSLLWCSGSLPWNYPRFLDYAAERILLRKVGGGYIFVHRLLLEYFVSLETPSPRM